MLNERVESVSRVLVYKSNEAESGPHHSLGFTHRQFHLTPTIAQQKFDWVFGVGLPIVCTAADPIVFRTWPGSGQALLGQYKIFAYALSIVSIMSMTAWLLWGHRLGELRPYLGGIFLAGSMISAIVGLILFPFSLLGMFFFWGFLGFTPLLSSFVYLRNGVRAIKGSKLDSPTRAVYQAVILAALYSLIVPFVLNF
jgi:hypothetical protein